ncbi:hypothetical protein [Enterobacter cloacae complex sp. P47BA]|uniref:hypothetical protein n=1 Tax=Enterobacter cloacae complex sp. P47BA TaxID=2779540 RepID=UPI001D03BA6C|nr:hypothetical protein [Enterobacter cloacae complex sp. P47BA]
MSAITKEQLQQIEAAAKEVLWPVVWSEKKARKHFSEKITPEVALELARIALASLEAEPVAYIFKHPAGRLFWLLTDESNKGQSDVISVYTAPPAPVSAPFAIHDEDFEKALSVLNDTLDDCGDSERGLLLALDKVGIEVRSDACRAATLQGAEPVTTAYKVPGDFESFISWLTGGNGIPDWLISGDKLDDEKTSFLLQVYRAGAQGADGNYPVVQDGLPAVCAEAYQVVGVMAEALGVFDDAAIQKVMDNLAQQKLVHCDVLPFSLPAAPQQEVTQALAKGIERYGDAMQELAKKEVK